MVVPQFYERYNLSLEAATQRFMEYSELDRILNNSEDIAESSKSNRKIMKSDPEWKSSLHAENIPHLTIGDSSPSDQFQYTFSCGTQTDGNVRKPAVAALIEGDMNSCYDCGFIGLQDTLHDSSGCHYFHRCYIEGSCDFIFGNGQSIYENCKISVTTNLPLAGIPGYITAQKRGLPDEPTDIVAPEGWDTWHKENENLLDYAEVDNNGLWEKKLSDSEVEMLVGEFHQCRRLD